MKFTCSVTVNKPKDVVARYFVDPNYLKEFQEGFLRKTPISGVAGQTGAVAKMYYKMGKGEMELTETITNNNMPDSFSGQYHHKHTDNTMHTTFTALSDNTTRVDSIIEYTAFRGFLINILKTLFPRMFRKQVDKWLQNFKKFVEKQ